MTSSYLLLVAAVLAAGYLAFVGVSALRRRDKGEIPANLRPGITDDELETKRLERTQQTAVLVTAFLAISLPIYYLTEKGRQEGFVEQFAEESVHRGEHLVIEYDCYGCHGPDGVGGAAAYTEKRTGVSVNWAAPPLNDVFYRYSPEEVNFWVTHGRGNSPMPAWGTEGGGPLNEQQVQDIVNYLQTIQLPEQGVVVASSNDLVRTELAKLEGVENSLDNYILEQRQLVASLKRSPELAPFAEIISIRAEQVLAEAENGLDTDGDGLSDVAEDALSRITTEAVTFFTPSGLQPLTFSPDDPATNGNPDRATIEAVLPVLDEVAADLAPIITPNIEAIRAALVLEGDDGDLDGISDTAEAQISAQYSTALRLSRPPGLEEIQLDPTNPTSSGGEDDGSAARRVVGELSGLNTNLTVNASNLDKLLEPAEAGLERLLQAKEERRWEIDIDGVAEKVFDGDTEQATRAVGLFLAYCARCHTSGYSAGVPFAQEPGSGSFGPPLWLGRATDDRGADGELAVSQFLTTEDLADFLLEGPRLNQPYGVNGFGSGRMPAFGGVLSQEDIDLLAIYVRSGNLNGKG